MTLEVLSRIYPTNNLLCDGEHCTDPNSKVRIVPLDDSTNVCLCESCFKQELSYNEQLELDGLDRTIPDVPFSFYPALLTGNK